MTHSFVPPPPRALRKTRIAPTPSGYLHLGNALSFALTAYLAQQAGARIFLRIDDLDRDRVQPAYVQDIFDTLHFLDIPWQEGPRNRHEYEQAYAQHYRLPLYEQALQQLAAGGHVFACTCSRAQLLRESPDGVYTGICARKNIPLDTPGVSWRLHTEGAPPVTVVDYSEGPIVAALPASMQYFVVRKKDGMPAYQLTSVVDDVHYGIDFIVRGEDLWASTVAQQYLATLLGAEAFGRSTFYHHALLLADNGEKLSKSAGATSIQYLRQQGHSRAEAFLLLAAQLGLPGNIIDWSGLAAAICAAK